MVLTSPNNGHASRASYHLSEEDKLHFLKNSTAGAGGRAGLPAGFPQKLSSPLAWSSAEVETRLDEYIVTLRAGDVENLEQALRHFHALELGPSDINKETFPVSEALARRLRLVSKQCYDGAGFCIVRGIDPDKYSLTENIVLFAGLSAYVAPGRGFQDKERKEVLCHITNRGLLKNAVKEQETPAFTDGALSFHTDFGEILALSTLEADKGGRLLLSSAWQIYNELAATRPDIIRTLSETWVWDTFTDHAKLPPYRMPLMDFQDGRLITHCSRYPLIGFGSLQRHPNLPAISPRQIEALNAIQVMAERNAIGIPNRKGDVLYVNNMAMLHAREALATVDKDGASALSKRHRLRLCLRDPERSWKIPQSYQRIWNQLYGPNADAGRRKEHWSMEPERSPIKKWANNG